MVLNNTESTNFINDEYLKFYKCLLKLNIHDTYDASNCLSFNSLFRIFDLMIEGMDGDSKKEINNSPIVQRLIASTPEPTKRRSGVFIREGYAFNEEYVKRIYNEKKNVILDTLPVTQRMVDAINEKISKKFPDMQGNFFDEPVNPACKMHIIDESFFEGLWQYPFDPERTKSAPFHLDDKSVKEVKTMKAEPNFITVYRDKAKRCKFINLPYKNNNKMLVILPDKAMNKKELVEFCIDELSGSDIDDFYRVNGKEEKCDYVTMPKFNFEFAWAFDQHFEKSIVKEFCPYLMTIFDAEKLNLRNMVKEFDLGFDFIDLSSHTKITNFEDGTTILTKTLQFACDCAKSDGIQVKINRRFLFAILDEKNKISNIGMYIGE